MSETVIGRHPPADGRDWDVQCARCGSSLDFDPCEACNGAGETEPGELYEEDPLWYDLDETRACSTCRGVGAYPHCLSDDASTDWCMRHPRPGRIIVPPSTPEWFTLDGKREEAAHG